MLKGMKGKALREGDDVALAREGRGCLWRPARLGAHMPRRAIRDGERARRDTGPLNEALHV